MDNNSQLVLSPKLLIKAMQGEQDAIAYYEQLHRMTSDKQDMDLIQGIHDDEIKHYNMFANLYYRMTGQMPYTQPKQPQIDSFSAGVKQSVMDELEAYEFYRDIYLANNNPEVKNIFFEAMTDENEHAVKHNYMYTKTLEAK